MTARRFWPVHRLSGPGVWALLLTLAFGSGTPAAADPTPPASASATEPPLLVALREEIIRVPKPNAPGVALQVTYFRPPGAGPFPWVILNHGKDKGDIARQPRARYLIASRELLQRGWAVVIPMRQGFADSGGRYAGTGCDVYRNGLAQAEDIQLTLQTFAQRPELDAQRVLIWGQSHGGLATLAAGTLKLPGVRGLVSFAGGLRNEACPDWANTLASAFGRYGQDTALPTLFFYGENDALWPPALWRDMVQRYTQAGGTAQLVAFGTFKPDAHALLGHPQGVSIWLPEVERFVRSLDLPFDKRFDLALIPHAQPVPPASGFANVRDVDALPRPGPTMRAGYSAFLAASPPKAFALSMSGAWGWRANAAQAMTDALQACNTRAAPGRPCQLYAVDDQVVWHPPPAQEISR